MDSPSIQARFAAQVARDPDAVAFSTEGGAISYRELDERSDLLARRLVRLGAGPETPVAVLMERSPDLIVATLAVVKTGSYYVPLHTAYPLGRLQSIADQLGGPLLLVDETTRERGLPEGCRPFLLSELTDAAAEAAELPLPVEVTPEHLAYVMFTSGSTGEPKGVAVTHRDALNLALDPLWDSDVYDRSLLIAPFAFGMSTFEVWAPLLHGRQIVIFPAGEIALTMLGEVIKRERVTVAHLTAGLFRLVAEEVPQVLAPLREVMTGGDVISSEAVARVLDVSPHLVVRAMYGATETTLFTTHSPITAPYTAGGTVPVGRPLHGKRIYLLDDELRPVPAGQTGEIYVAGAGIARGYLGRPEQTAERFLADPFAGDGTRMYRTGDVGRWNDGDSLDLLGRADDQVKIRGFRVEPAEVEARLAAYPGVSHVAVTTREMEQGDKRLIAYVVPKPGLEMAALQEYAVGHLPDYMVPAAFVVLDELPLTANGKVDRAALPAPAVAAEVVAQELPRTPSEEIACTVFAETLSRPSVGLDENFFELSGQSLQAIRIIMRIEQMTGVRLPIEVLYDNPTPGLLAGQIDKEQASGAAKSAVAAS